MSWFSSIKYWGYQSNYPTDTWEITNYPTNTLLMNGNFHGFDICLHLMDEHLEIPYCRGFQWFPVKLPGLSTRSTWISKYWEFPLIGWNGAINEVQICFLHRGCNDANKTAGCNCCLLPLIEQISTNMWSHTACNLELVCPLSISQTSSGTLCPPCKACELKIRKTWSPRQVAIPHSGRPFPFPGASVQRPGIKK